MAEPYTDDLAALGKHTRSGLRSLASTRAVCTSPERKPPMRFFKARPALATVLVLAILCLLAPVAYAIVDRVFLSVDVTKSEAEIEQDLQQQLQQAGHGNATVKATKGDHEFEIAITSQDPNLAGNLEFQIVAGDRTWNVHLAMPDWLNEEQGVAVGEAASTALKRANGETDAQLEKWIVDELAKHGMKNVTAQVRDSSLSIVVR